MSSNFKISATQTNQICCVADYKDIVSNLGALILVYVED